MADWILPDTTPYPRTALFWDGTDWRPGTIDAAGHLQIDVLTSGLPAGAATAANQVTMITALQLIDDLRNALQSVNTDALQVRGEDQLFSYDEPLYAFATMVTVGAGAYNLDTPGVPANDVWVVTTVVAQNATTVGTQIAIAVRSGGVDYFIATVASPAIADGCVWSGHTYIENPDHIRVVFGGCGGADTLNVWATGHIMSAE